MKNSYARRMYAVLSLAGAMVAGAALPASAQFQPRTAASTPAAGETYHIEASAAYWVPTADIVVASTGFNIPGSQIDFKKDLGLTDQKFPALSLILRPARKHKFRLQYIPLKYEQSTTLHQDIVFNGQRYSLGLPVNSSLIWKAYRFGYEYDFISRPKIFAGVVLEAKYTDVTATLTLPLRNLNEFDHAKAPIPAIGGIVRVYVIPQASITADVTGFTVPQSLADKIEPGSKAHYVDVDVAGTYNVTRNIGAQLGYRSLDMGYTLKADSGAFKFKGMYFGVVARY